MTRQPASFTNFYVTALFVVHAPLQKVSMRIGKIIDRDQFDLLRYAIQTSIHVHQEPAEYLINAATSGKPISIMGGNRQRLSSLAEACEEVGLSYHVTELDD
jgi:hypothetical protein